MGFGIQFHKKSKYLSVMLLMVLAASLFTFVVPSHATSNSREAPQQIKQPFLDKLLLSNANSNSVYVASVVIKGKAGYSKVKQIYDELSKEKVKIHGHYFPATLSRLVKVKGNYIFKVAAPASLFSKYLKPIMGYLKGVYGKPLLELEEAKPLMKYVADGEPVKTSFKNIKPDTFVVRQIIGADAVQEEYGFNGSGVKIAIVDTGVDYGHPDLHDALAYYVNTTSHTREPLVLDADESHVILFQKFQANSSGYINTKGKSFTVLMPWPIGVTADKDYYVGDITSQSGNYSFGMTYLFLPAYGILRVGVLMVDPETAGNYTEVYIDLNDNGNFTDPSDIAVTYDGDRVLAKDLNGDGFPDISLGVAGGFFYDWGWWFSYPGKIYPGWDRNGNYLSIFYDFFGHGTSCASAAAGRGVASPMGLGIAPGAKIIGVKGLWIGNVELGMLWAAGFNVDPSSGQVYWSGSKRADIISNSWGISYFIYDIAGFGYDFESTFINGLMTPGFLDPNYPGILVVQAAGNGGNGFGTVTSPGSAVNALTVGASTSMHPFYYLYGFYGFDYDEVVGWSARGPTVYGLAKPDVVNVGAWGFTAAPVGINYWIFGGTSYATPLTAGAAALLYQGMKTWLGSSADNVDPRIVKLIIKDTARDIGYGPFMQGAGRVDIYHAVNLLLSLIEENGGGLVEPATALIYSTSPYNKTAEKLSALWKWMWSDYIPDYMMGWVGVILWVQNPSMPSSFSSLDYGIYVPDIPQGGSKEFSFTFYNPTGNYEVVNAEAVRLTKYIGPIYKYVKVSTFERYGYFYGYTYMYLSPSQIPSNAKMLVIDEAIPYNWFDVGRDYAPDYSPDIIVYIWVGDFNHNGYPDVDERVLVNHAYSVANQNTLEIANPRQLILKYGPGARLAIRIGLSSYEGKPITLPVKVGLTYYTFTRDPSVFLLAPRHGRNVNVNPYSEVNFKGIIRVSSYAIPSVYDDYLKVDVKSGTAEKTYMVPFTYTVFTSLNSMVPRQLNSGSETHTLYSYKTIKGDTDWSWRYESGDWRVFYGRLTNPRIYAFEYTVKWSDPMSSYITYTLGPDGQFTGLFYGAGASYHFYIGSGIFIWMDTGTATIPNTRSIKTFPSTTYRFWQYPTSRPNLGIYTFIVRTGEYGGRYLSEPFGIYVRPLRGPSYTGSQVYPVNGTAYMRFAYPYPTNFVEAFPWVNFVPYLWSTWWCLDVGVTPYVYTGTYPAWHTFTFKVNWTNYCSYVTRNDITLLTIVNMSSIPVYYSIGYHYYIWSTYYVFQNWITTGARSYGIT